MKFQKQKGVALVVGLIMLLVLTIMGVSSMSNTTMELKIAGNYRTHTDAFQEAMSAVEDVIVQASKSVAAGGGGVVADEISKLTVGGPSTPEFTHLIPGSNATAKVTVALLGCQRVYGASLETNSYELVYRVDSHATAIGSGGEAFSNTAQAIGVKIPAECPEA